MSTVIRPDNWNRDEPQWYNMKDLRWEGLSDHRLGHNVNARVISRASDSSGSVTTMLQIPTGWSLVQPDNEGTIEIFILEGRIEVEGSNYGAGGFIAISPGCGDVALRSESGAKVIAFLNPQLSPPDCYNGEFVAKETWSVDWQPFIQAEDQRHGLLYKTLRTPDVAVGNIHGGRHGMLRLVLIAPGYTAPEHEYHEDSWEELIFLSGDLVMPNRGVGQGGTVLSNPASYPHGPYGTQRGVVMLCHALNPQPTAYLHLPGGQEAMEEYFHNESVLDSSGETHGWESREREDLVLRRIAARESVG